MMWNHKIEDYMNKEEIEQLKFKVRDYDEEETKRVVKLFLKIYIVRDKLRKLKPLDMKDIMDEEEYKSYLWSIEGFTTHMKRRTHEEQLSLFVFRNFDKIFQNFTIEDIKTPRQAKEWREYYMMYQPNSYEKIVKETIHNYKLNTKAKLHKIITNLKSPYSKANQYLEHVEKYPEQMKALREERERKKKLFKENDEALRKLIKPEIDKDLARPEDLHYKPKGKPPFFYLIQCPNCMKWSVKQYMTLIKRDKDKRFVCPRCDHRRKILSTRKCDLNIIGEFYDARIARARLLDINNKPDILKDINNKKKSDLLEIERIKSNNEIENFDRDSRWHHVLQCDNCNKWNIASLTKPAEEQPKRFICKNCKHKRTVVTVRKPALKSLGCYQTLELARLIYDEAVAKQEKEEWELKEKQKIEYTEEYLRRKEYQEDMLKREMDKEETPKGPYHYIICCKSCLMWSLKKYNTLIKPEVNKIFKCNFCKTERKIVTKKISSLTYIGPFYDLEYASKKYLEIRYKEKAQLIFIDKKEITDHA